MGVGQGQKGSIQTSFRVEHTREFSKSEQVFGDSNENELVLFRVLQRIGRIRGVMQPFGKVQR